MSQLTICLIIFVLTVIGYCSGKFSLGTFGITALIAFTLTGCLSPEQALSCFSDDNVIMIGAMCIVAEGFNRTKYCRMITEAIARAAKGSLVRTMAGYVLISILLSQMIQSPAVVFGIVAPMLRSSAEALGVKPSKVMFGVGAAAVVTCCILPIGQGATVAAELNGYLSNYGYTDYVAQLTDGMLGRFPMLFIAFIFCVFIAPRLSPAEPVVEVDYTMKKGAENRPLTNLQNIAGLMAFVLTAAALMFSGQLGLESWQCTIMGALAMIFFGVLKPKEAGKALPIGMLMLIVGSNGISNALSSTGAGELIGSHIGRLVNAVNGNSYIVGLIFFIVPFIQTQFMSNRGTMLIYHPIAIATCAATGSNPIGLMILIQSACLSAYMTPSATSAIPYIMGYGGYDQKTMIKISWPLSLMCCIVSVLWIMTVFPLQ